MSVLRTGFDCFTYYSSGTAYESPTWTLTDLVKDESLDLSKGRAEFAARYSRYKRKKGTTIEAPASMSIEYRKNNAFITAVRDSFINGTVLDMAFMFDDITEDGAEGFRMPVEVFDFPLSRNLEEGAIFEVEVELTEFLDVSGDLVDLEWMVISV